MITISLAVAALLAPGDRVCWAAPLPSETNPRLLVVTVVQLARTERGEPAAWVTADGMHWRPRLTQLQPLSACGAAS